MPEPPQNSNDESVMANAPARASLARWGIPLAGLAAVMICAIASVILIRLYVASRPVNIAPANAAMVRHIEDLLVMCQLPESSILRHAPVTRHDEGAVWDFYAFDVGVPATMSAQTVINTVKQGMALQNVALSEVEAVSPPGTELRFSMLDREFSVVRIIGGAEQYDLRAVCDELANTVNDVLAKAPKVVEMTRTTVEEQQDGPTQWCLHDFRLTGAPGIDVTELAERLSMSFDAIRGETPGVLVRESARVLEVVWQHLPVVRVTLEHTPAFFAPSKKDFTTNPWLIYEELPLLFQSLFGFDPGILESSMGFSAALSSNTDSVPRDAPASVNRSRVAIVVDDGGYGGLVSDAILTMDPRLTLSVLPGTPFATDTATAALVRGFEVLLHMPLESGDSQNPYPGELTTAMDATEMEKQIEASLAQVPGAVGMNNHTGSKFTADDEAMKRLLGILKKRELFFVDSRTTAETVAETVARELGVPVASRSVFLDNETEPDYIRGQIAALVETAKTTGGAIGICHFRGTTAAMLPETIRFLETNGISLVHVSELVQ